jgi:hypothetical protein
MRTQKMSQGPRIPMKISQGPRIPMKISQGPRMPMKMPMKISQGPRIPMKISQHPLKLVRYLLNLIFTNNTLIKSKITNQSIYKPPSSI